MGIGARLPPWCFDVPPETRRTDQNPSCPVRSDMIRQYTKFNPNEKHFLSSAMSRHLSEIAWPCARVSLNRRKGTYLAPEATVFRARLPKVAMHIVGLLRRAQHH